MSAEEVRTERGQERLDACVFRLPYRGEMVPMCRMNAEGVREELYAEILESAAPEELPARKPRAPIGRPLPVVS
jgi:hypothetical protein